MSKVTYGVASSSYQSTRCFFECSTFEKVSPEVQKALHHHFYKDDIFTGATSEKAGKILHTQFIETIKQLVLFDLERETQNQSASVLHQIIEKAMNT